MCKPNCMVELYLILVNEKSPCCDIQIPQTYTRANARWHPTLIKRTLSRYPICLSLGENIITTAPVTVIPWF